MTATLPTRPESIPSGDVTQTLPRKAAKVVPAAILYVTNGPTAGRVLRVDQDAATIGRDPANTHVIDDPSVSRVHARLQCMAGEIVLTDLGSSSGTWVDGEPLRGAIVLTHGCEVQLGRIELVFEHPVAACRDEEVTEEFQPAREVEPEVTLSPRKHDVVTLLAEGLTNAQIAERLGLAELTIKSYTDELYRELDVHSRAAAVAEAIRLGLL